MLTRYILVAFALLSINTNTAYAEEQHIYCLAIHPCNPDGSVFERYNVGPCAARYIKECLSSKANSAIASCESEQEKLEKQVTRLKKETDRLRRTKR